MITRQEIAAEEDLLSPVAQALWLALFRSYPANTGDYPALATKLEAAHGVTAQQLNAALRKIEEIGAGTVRIEGGKDALNYDPVRDRKELIAYGLAVLDETGDGCSTPPAFIVVT